MNKYSLIIATHNRAESLQRTLLSLGELERALELLQEVIIVDNNSDDHTPEIVRDFQKRFVFDVIYIFEKRKGKSIALNEGIRRAKADIIAFTDDDVVFSKDWLLNADTHFQNPKMSCLTGRIIPVINAEKPSWYSERLSSVIGNVDIDKEKKQTEYLTGSNMFIKRDILNHINGFEIRESLINEDTFLSLKIRQFNYTITYDPDVIIYHHFQPERFNKIYFRRWYKLAGRTIAELNKQKDKGYPCRFNIPLWRYRQTVEHALMMLWNLFNEPERFYHELQIRRFAGFCYQRWFSKQS